MPTGQVMIIHRMHDDSNYHVVNLLKETFSKITDKSLVENYHPDYEAIPSNIFYILKNENGRYKQGCYYVIETEGKFVCSSGWNQYEHDPDIALVLTRTYIEPIYRGKYYLAEYILPNAIEEAKFYKKIWLTVNEYNKTMYNWFMRADLGKSTGLANNWPSIYKKFKPIGKKNIYHVEQYVMEYQKTNP